MMSSMIYYFTYPDSRFFAIGGVQSSYHPFLLLVTKMGLILTGRRKKISDNERAILDARLKFA